MENNLYIKDESVYQQEIWKDVVGYEGLYQVSYLGNVRSCEASFNHRYGQRVRVSKMKAQATTKSGYKTVNLFRDNWIKVFKVHRLLMIAFVPNLENKKTVNHKDGDKANNNINNLEWATHSENVNHAVKNGLKNTAIGQDSASSKLYNQDVIEIRILSERGIRHRILSSIFGVSENQISLIINNKSWSHL